MSLYKKNDIVTVTITQLGINGEGIAKLQDTPIFVPFTAIGEVVEVKIIKVSKTFYVGKAIKFLQKSSHRVEAPCPVFTKCGGCQLQHLSYSEQLHFKTNLVKETFSKLGFIEPKVNECVKSEKEYHYRNKISLPIRQEEGRLQVGFFANNSHRIVPIEVCPLQKPLTNRVIKVVTQFLKEYKVSAYNSQTKLGLVKHLVAREFQDALLVAVVINGSNLPNAKKLYELLKEHFNKVTLYLNHNTQHNNVILGSKNTLVAGEPLLVEQLHGITLKTDILSFMQINNDIRDKMYAEALQKANAFSPSTIIDAYSGAGLLSGIFAKNTHAAIIGLEIVLEAVTASNEMLKKNQLQHRVKNILGDCATTLPQVMKEQSGKTTLVVDPPRKGLDKSIIRAILQSKPQQIIYIACGLTTLARDLGYLLNTKNIDTEQKKVSPMPIYEVVSVTPYDMFPQTKHVETLVELRLKNS
jgi:23S rRNA (uracil1939-C5)-methyltransferase